MHMYKYNGTMDFQKLIKLYTISSVFFLTSTHMTHPRQHTDNVTSRAPQGANKTGATLTYLIGAEKRMSQDPNHSKTRTTIH